MRVIGDVRGKVEEVPEKEEQWTWVYPVLVVAIGWVVAYLVLR